jgi:hypothetical protein
MKIILSIFLTGLFILYLTSCNDAGRSEGKDQNRRIIKVPGEFPTIRSAVENAGKGDWIILSPGSYVENNITIDKKITISSEWKTAGEESKIEETIIDPKDSILFNILADSIEIIGLKIINGDHPLNINARAIIMHNHFINNRDAISFEGSGGGHAGYNLIENDRDDGIDLDIRFGEDNFGSDIVVEHNTIMNSHDDGMEIRLYDYENQNIKYTINDNRITGSTNAGIQIISYDIFTGKSFRIHHNVIRDCKTGVSCMEGANTRENTSGASKMDELVCLYNNSLIGNQVGATGGNKFIALNNLVINNSQGGFKRFGQNSVVKNNLFFNNGVSDFVEFNGSVVKEGNIFSVNPLIDKDTFAPLPDSPCINAGLKNLKISGDTLLTVTNDYINGSAPDIGAIEFK